MDDDVFHLRIVDAPLGLAAPGFLGRGKAVVDADEVDRIEVGEIESAWILDPAAEDEVKFAHVLAATASVRFRQPWLRTASSAASADARAVSFRPSIKLLMVSSPFSRVRPRSLKRCLLVSRAASTAARALAFTRRAVGRTRRVSASVRGSSAAISAPAAI